MNSIGLVLQLQPQGTALHPGKHRRQWMPGTEGRGWIFFRICGMRSFSAKADAS